jgi:hypothetical protein
MLSFLSPLFLAGAAAAAIPIVLHLLKREPEPRVKFSAVKLLKRAPVENTEKRHLRELILLALRIATLVLLALPLRAVLRHRRGFSSRLRRDRRRLDISYACRPWTAIARQQRKT